MRESDRVEPRPESGALLAASQSCDISITIPARVGPPRRGVIGKRVGTLLHVRGESKETENSDPSSSSPPDAGTSFLVWNLGRCVVNFLVDHAKARTNPVWLREGQLKYNGLKNCPFLDLWDLNRGPVPISSSHCQGVANGKKERVYLDNPALFSEVSCMYGEHWWDHDINKKLILRNTS